MNPRSKRIRAIANGNFVVDQFGHFIRRCIDRFLNKNRCQYWRTQCAIINRHHQTSPAYIDDIARRQRIRSDLHSESNAVFWCDILMFH